MAKQFSRAQINRRGLPRLKQDVLALNEQHDVDSLSREELIDLIMGIKTEEGDPAQISQDDDELAPEPSAPKRAPRSSKTSAAPIAAKPVPATRGRRATTRQATTTAPAKKAARSKPTVVIATPPIPRTPVKQTPVKRTPAKRTPAKETPAKEVPVTPAPVASTSKGKGRAPPDPISPDLAYREASSQPSSPSPSVLPGHEPSPFPARLPSARAKGKEKATAQPVPVPDPVADAPLVPSHIGDESSIAEVERIAAAEHGSSRRSLDLPPATTETGPPVARHETDQLAGQGSILASFRAELQAMKSRLANVEELEQKLKRQEQTLSTILESPILQNITSVMEDYGALKAEIEGIHGRIDAVDGMKLRDLMDTLEFKLGDGLKELMEQKKQIDALTHNAERDTIRIQLLEQRPSGKILSFKRKREGGDEPEVDDETPSRKPRKLNIASEGTAKQWVEEIPNGFRITSSAGVQPKTLQYRQTASTRI